MKERFLYLVEFNFGIKVIYFIVKKFIVFLKKNL